MAERNTEMRQPLALVSVALAAVAVEAGKLAVINAAGYGAEGSEALNLKYLGRWEESIDNSAGQAGALVATARIDAAFKWNNSVADAVTQAELGKVVYIEDDETVSKGDNSAARSPAGVCIGVESDGVWVMSITPHLQVPAEASANSIIANNTALAAAPAAVAVAASRIIGRKASGNLGALTPAEVNAILGSSHIVVASGIHDWAGGTAATDSIAVVGLLATDIVVATLVARAATETLVMAANDAGNDQIDLTLSANGTDSTTKVAYTVLRAIA